MIQRLMALALLVLALGTAGCGTTCREIREHRADFDARRRTTRGPDARLDIPFALMDRVLEGADDAVAEEPGADAPQAGA